jgi:Ca2+-transporting ATPase
MVHMGTAITAGRGTFLVTATGARTEMGRIGTLIDEVGEHVTPLEAKLAQLSRALLVIVLALCVVIVLAGWLQGNDLFHMIEVGISLAIAAVPEGLLAVTTMTLAVGMQRMARMNALVRRLPAVEALGSTTVICTDKTGTLTRNEMTVRVFEVADMRVDVAGTGYAAEGGVHARRSRRWTWPPTPLRRRRSAWLFASGALQRRPLERKGDATNVLGDPTEAALIVAAEKSGLVLVDLERDYPRRLRRFPFNSETKRMATTHRTPEGKTMAYVKGSPGAVMAASVSVLGSCGRHADVGRGRAKKGLATNDALAASALRVLGLAYRELPAQHEDADLTRDLTFVGLVGMIDPLRDEAKATIATCREAGIRAIMITGDQQATAAEIARQLGLDLDLEGKPLRTVHARDLAGLDDAGWLEPSSRALRFSRACLPSTS